MRLKYTNEGIAEAVERANNPRTSERNLRQELLWALEELRRIRNKHMDQLTKSYELAQENKALKERIKILEGNVDNEKGNL